MSSNALNRPLRSQFGVCWLVAGWFLVAGPFRQSKLEVGIMKCMHVYICILKGCCIMPAVCLQAFQV